MPDAAPSPLEAGAEALAKRNGFELDSYTIKQRFVEDAESVLLAAINAIPAAPENAEWVELPDPTTSFDVTRASLRRAFGLEGK